VSNSDPFEHIHRKRDSHSVAAVETWQRQLASVAADLHDMLRARRVDVLAPGSGLAGNGRSNTVADPTGNTALQHDPSVERWASFDLAFAEITHGFNTLIAVGQAELANPTPTGLCRHGHCPERKIATRGVKARDGVPRCEACYKFWCLDVSDIDDPDNPREERQHLGQSPRRIGLDKVAS
jgi:hypothetical protein